MKFDGFEDMHDLPAAGAPQDDGLANVTLYKEDCKKCGGSGNWRPGYKCFACKGKGTLEFRTSSSVRAKARKRGQTKAAKKVVDCLAEWHRYLEARKEIADWLKSSDGEFSASLSSSGAKYGSLTQGQERAILTIIADEIEGLEEFTKHTLPSVLKWLVDNRNESTFAASLYSAGCRYGKLSEGQVNAVLRNIADSGEEDDAVAIDLSDLPTGFYAVPDGDTRLKIAVRRPRKNSNWYGWIFVDDGAEYGNRKNYGRQGPDALYKGKIREQLMAVLANPLEALKAYGHLTGSCGVCGRHLEDEESVALGIGPICAGKLEL